MKNWNIGARIAAGFAVVILIAARLGIFAYLKLGVIENDAKRITQTLEDGMRARAPQAAKKPAVKRVSSRASSDFANMHRAVKNGSIRSFSRTPPPPKKWPPPRRNSPVRPTFFSPRSASSN